jgi:penicillin-binding protein 1C
VLVWVGNTTGEGRPDLVGIKTAAPALFEIFRFLPSSDWFETPSSGFTYLPVCHYSGFKAGNDCSIIDTTLVGETAIQSAICPYCRKINLDRTGNFRANESCETPGNMIQQSYFVLPPTMEYYYKQKHSDYTSLPPFRKGCELESSSELDIVYPDNNAKILVPKEITGMKGKTIFVASHKSEDATLFWHLDNTYIGSTQHYHQIALAPVVGKHIITIVDENGNSISRKFEIVATVKN